MAASVTRRERLSSIERTSIAEEARAWSRATHHEALPEQAVLNLESGPPTCHLIGEDEGALLYAQGQPAGDALEFVMLADRLPSRLLDAALACAQESGLALSVWTRHATSQRSAPASDRTSTLDREILRLSGPLEHLPPTATPDGITISTFQPGRDERELLGLNARAFADHPEQGSMSAEDLARRSAQQWFDPQGLLIVRKDGAMVAFCWTKVHHDPWGAIGEIYVIGVDPSMAGRGLGRLAVTAGLEHLARKGLTRTMLYVEADNQSALALYGSLGLMEDWRDQRWRFENQAAEAPTRRPTP